MASTVSALKNAQRTLYLAIAVLLVAEGAYLLKGLVSYVFVVFFALAIFALHWLTRHNSKVSKWRKGVALAMPVVTIVGPIAYIVYLLVSDSPSFWLHLAMTAGFVLPLLLMMLAIYQLNRVIRQQTETPAG